MLRQRYGDQVDIKYIDISDREIYDYPRIAEMVQNGELFLPVVLFDGEVLGSGYISYPRIIKELDDRNIRAV